MSVYSDIFYTTLIGTKENVIRMLNAAICNVGTGNMIVDGDDLETINHKIKEADGHYGLRVAFPDLLDEVCMQDEQLLMKKNAFSIPEEDEEYSYTARCIDIVEVTEQADKYAVKFSHYEDECGGTYVDWLFWDDLARIYDFQIFMDDDEYRNGHFIRFCGTSVYTSKDGIVEKRRIEPELDLEKYNDTFEELIKLYPERYRMLKIHNYQDKINRLQNEIIMEGERILRERYMKEKGISIDMEMWERFAEHDKDGIDSLDYIYNWYVDIIAKGNAPWASKEDLETILMLRADKWKGINKEVSDYYSVLLTNLPNDIEKKAKEWKSFYAKRQELEDIQKKYDIIIPVYVWNKLLSAEEAGLNEIDHVYMGTLEQLVKGNGFTEETFKTILQIRAERWRGDNDAIADYYNSLLAHFENDLEMKRSTRDVWDDGLPF